jgi:predicted DNA-binding transcriptional regulator AlpA
MKHNEQQSDRILRFQEVCKLVGLSKRTIHNMEQENLFPMHVKLTTRAIGWRYNEIMKWIEERK